MGKFSERLGRSGTSTGTGTGIGQDTVEEKISERMLKFASPLTTSADGSKPDENKLRSALLIAIAVWNAQVLEALGKPDVAERTLKAVESAYSDPRLGNVIETLVARKQELFADDFRLITDFTVSPGPDGDARVKFKYQQDPRV